MVLNSYLVKIKSNTENGIERGHIRLHFHTRDQFYSIGLYGTFIQLRTIKSLVLLFRFKIQHQNIIGVCLWTNGNESHLNFLFFSTFQHFFFCVQVLFSSKWTKLINWNKRCNPIFVHIFFFLWLSLKIHIMTKFIWLNSTYSWSRLCLNESLYLSRKFLRISVVSFSCRLFDSSAGNRSAVSIKWKEEIFD